MNARTLLLQVDEWPGHLAGQHIDVRLTSADGYQAERSYSIASPPHAPKLEILVERIPGGEVSPYLTQDVRPGDHFEVRGPIGGFFVWKAAQGGPLLLVAGGSGIAPLASILAYRAKAAAGLPTCILYSARTAEEIIFRKNLDLWAHSDPSLTVTYTLTRAGAAEWPGYRRRIDLDMLREVAFRPDEMPLAYICGPSGMVEQTANGLVSLGYASDSVRTERFGPSGDPSP